ncbi:MAG: hypothetical protein JST51_09645 [Armatimonadetes bacterium]|nr:hypothetical protein [Armatimonadota bacterium]
MVVKTTFTWIGSGSPPSDLKLILAGASSGGYHYADSGTGSADDGLGHTATQTGPVSDGTYGYRGGGSCHGTRYRKFAVKDGKVTIKTSLYSDASCTGGTCSTTDIFSADETDWYVDIIADRDETFRRVVVGGTPTRISDYLDDDGVSYNADGMKHGDSAATEPSYWPADHRFFYSSMYLDEGGFDLSNSTFTFTSSALLGGGGSGSYDYFLSHLNTGYADIPDSPAKPLKTYTASGSGNDSTNNISDDIVYEMKVHLLAEKEEHIASSTSGYLHHVPEEEEFTDWDGSPGPPVNLTFLDNPGPGDKPLTITQTGEVDVTSGFNYSLGTPELSNSVAKVLFGGNFTYSCSLTWKKVTGATLVDTVPAGYRHTWWVCATGIVQKDMTSRWDYNGYTGVEAIAYSVDGAGYGFTFTSSPSGEAGGMP